MLVITFLRVDYQATQIIFLWVAVVVGPGVGNVVRSFVLLTSIQKQVIKIRMLKNRTTLSAVKRRLVLNRTSIAQADIIVIVRSGGTKKS